MATLPAVTGFVNSAIKPVSGGPLGTAGSGDSGWGLTTLGAQGGTLLGTTATTAQTEQGAPSWTYTNGQAALTPGTTNTKGGTYYNTALDQGVGAIDAQIKALGSPGTYNFDQTKYDALMAKRREANIQRWNSVHTDGNAGPGFKALQMALQRGDLTMDDLGNIDISELGNDSQLLAAVTDAVANKKAAAVSPPPPAAPPVDPTIQEGKDANGAIDDSLKATTDYIDSQMGKLNTFDQGVQDTEHAEASNNANLAHFAGAEAAGMAAGQAGANTAAQGSAQRDVLQQNQKTDLESFLADSLNKDIGDKSSLANMDVAKRVQIQSQAADHLADTIKNEIGKGDAAAQGQLQDLQAAINDWKAHMQDQDQGAEFWKKVVKIGAGLLMTGAGVALTVGTGGAGAVAGGGLIAGGIGTTANGATS